MHHGERPELTIRAVVTGMVIGALLTPCNVYSGLKIGWTFNMSVAAGLIGFAFWRTAQSVFSSRPLQLRENNINQTTTSASASIISAGIAAPIPALALLTGQTLALPILAIWLFVVSVLGIVVAAGLRNQLLLREQLPFPAGIVTAETMQEIHAGGPEAARRVRLLALCAGLSGGLKFLLARLGIGPIAPTLKASIPGTVNGGNATTVSAMNLGWALDPSVLMFGFGAIAGLRIGASVLIGAVIGWGMLAPLALSYGWVKPGPQSENAVWFGQLVEWLLWPGATLMVAASLSSFVISVARLLLRRRESSLVNSAQPVTAINLRNLIAGFLIATVLVTSAQVSIFNIGLLQALIAVLLSYALAVVAARVSGETAITPVGALGKITQLTFGIIAPANVTTNLMTANVTGGAAGQCADLMHDLRTGQLIGATPGFQVVAQVFGVLAGALVASTVYLVLIPDPQVQLITTEWPAPAVVTWKAVAEVLSEGLEAMPPAAIPAIVVATMLGVALSAAHSLTTSSTQRFIPSASAIGLGFVIPAWNSISLFLGASTAALVLWIFPNWARRRTLVIAAGLIVGESLAGVIEASVGILT